MVYGSRFRVWGLGFMVLDPVYDNACVRVWGFGIGVWGVGLVQGSEFRFAGVGCREQGVECRV